MITSTSNPKVKEWASLLLKKGREEKGRFLIEGSRLVEEAIRSGAQVEAVIWQTGKSFPFLEHLCPQGKQWEASEAVIRKLTTTEEAQGIVAVVRIGEGKDSLIRDKEPVKDAGFTSLVHNSGRSLQLLADGISDPGNLGTIIRTADAAGADGVLLGEGTVDLYNPKTVRSTMGSLFHLPILRVETLKVLSELKKAGVQIVAASLRGKTDFREAVYKPHVLVVVGNEAHGLSPEVEKMADLKVQIPIYGQAESLNVAIAAALMLYEVRRGVQGD